MIYMDGLDFEVWPRTYGSFVRKTLRSKYGIWLKQSHSEILKDWMNTETEQDFEHRSLSKLFNMRSFWETKATFSLIVNCK
jgi:hypothetical protein